jgi:hypothetical protein
MEQKNEIWAGFGLVVKKKLRPIMSNFSGAKQHFFLNIVASTTNIVVA